MTNQPKNSIFNWPHSWMIPSCLRYSRKIYRGSVSIILYTYGYWMFLCYLKIIQNSTSDLMFSSKKVGNVGQFINVFSLWFNDYIKQIMALFWKIIFLLARLEAIFTVPCNYSICKLFPYTDCTVNYTKAYKII
jgi:hypothetical protein